MQTFWVSGYSPIAEVIAGKRKSHTRRCVLASVRLFLFNTLSISIHENSLLDPLSFDFRKPFRFR